QAGFKCDNGCRVYTDFHSDMLVIREYFTQTNTFADVGSCAELVRVCSHSFPPPCLQVFGQYSIENRGLADPSFVFYAVDNQASNAGTPVLVVADDNILDVNGDGRLVTILSSKYNAVHYAQFHYESNLTIQKDYPRIFATGFDAVAEQACTSTYQAR
ncbi:hypothetical protein PENTCL1PPCAC_15905, partial [Pristionchus entomophagus]